MRLFFGSIVFVTAMISFGHRADAEPCAIRVHDAYLDTTAHEFDVTFASLVEGTADIRVTLTAGDTAYAVHLPDVRFERTVRADHSPWPWRSSRVLVRVPSDARPPSLAVVTLLDPTTKAPIACDGGLTQVAPTINQPIDVRMEAAATAGAPVDAIASPAAARVCDVPSASARTDRVAQATYPFTARALRETGKVFVRIDLAETGSIIAAAIERSSGFGDLDAAARDAAIRTTYFPERFDCEAVAGAYLFEVDFTGR